MNDKSELLGQLKIDRDTQHDNSRPWLWPLLIVSALVLAALLWWLLRDNAPQVELVTVQTEQAQGGQAAASVLDASGYVIARRQATVSAQITGQVREVLVEEGLRVEQDQVLARLDDDNARAQLALAAAQEAAADAALAEVDALITEVRKRRRRIVELRQRNAASDADVDAVQAELDSQIARRARLIREVAVAAGNRQVQQEVLDDHVIRAPFAGVVTVKAAQPGEMISPISAGSGYTRTGVATLVDMASLEIEVDVNENFINRVQAGQNVNARLNAYPDWTIPARVIAVVPAADRTKATVRVRIELLEQDARVLPDMGVRVAFLSEAQDDSASPQRLVSVPQQAVITQGGRALVYVWRDGSLERRAVGLAGRQGERQLISAGLSAGDQVALPLEDVVFEDGMAVRKAD